MEIFPEADVICDVGGTDVKIMILRQGTVADFRLNSQCSSGNGAFLQGVAERYGIPLEDYADKAFEAKAMPALAMGCGVFLQSDIVNQQRKGWSAEEIMASLAAVLPLNVWIYAGQLQNLRSVGGASCSRAGPTATWRWSRRRSISSRPRCPTPRSSSIPIPARPARSARRCARWRRGTAGRPARSAASTPSSSSTTARRPARTRSASGARSTASAPSSTSSWTAPRAGLEQGAAGGGLGAGDQRQLLPQGLVEDVNEMKAVKAEMEEQRRVFPNIGEMVRENAFRRAWTPA
jgi:hypothetical protein